MLGEADQHLTLYWCQFHQRFTRGFFIRMSFWQLHVSRKSCRKELSYVKFASITLMKLTAGFLLNYRNVLMKLTQSLFEFGEKNGNIFFLVKKDGEEKSRFITSLSQPRMSVCQSRSHSFSSPTFLNILKYFGAILPIWEKALKLYKWLP